MLSVPGCMFGVPMGMLGFTQGNVRCTQVYVIRCNQMYGRYLGVPRGMLGVLRDM